MGKTPIRTFRCEDEIWDPATDAAKREGETVSDVLRRALIDYAEEHS